MNITFHGCVRFLHFAGLASALMALAACATPAVEQPNEGGRPAWIDNPGDGVSASAGVHVRGRVAQEELAVTRAREELAKRMGVTISSQSLTEQRVTNERLASTSNKQIQETVSGAEVKAVVKAKWLEPGSQVLWVWLLPSP
jgi:hypothetical protein